MKMAGNSGRMKFIVSEAQKLMKSGKSRKVAFKEASELYKKKGAK
jgi:hypothetical protein